MFYPKLAFTNIKKNGKTYIPYMITCILIVMMFYVMNAIGRNTGLDQMPGAASLKIILSWADVITGIFSAIFLFYTNSFLVKQRKKELGLYQVLGMDKGNLAKMMIWETILTAAVSLISGLLLGMLFGRLMFLVLLKMLHFEVPLQFAVEPQAMVVTVNLFLAVFVVTLLFNLLQVQTANPAELLHGGNQGEKEPKTKWILALLGVATLGAGYYIAQTTQSPLAAISKFFIAVVLVIVGTYCLFTAGSIAILKLLKKNKNFYYQSRHFISVSGMIYRMKQNAVGLANICIMSTVVLVLISVTVSLYAGMEDILETRFPTDFSVFARDASQENIDKISQIIEEETKEAGVQVENRSNFRYGSFTAIYNKKDNQLLLENNKDTSYETEDFRTLEFIPLSDYNRMEQKEEVLKADQVILCAPDDKWDSDTIQVEEERFQVKKVLRNEFRPNAETSNVVKSFVMIVPDVEKIVELKETYGFDETDRLTYVDDFDLKGKEASKEEAMKAMNERISKELSVQAQNMSQHSGQIFTHYMEAFCSWVCLSGHCS